MRGAEGIEFAFNPTRKTGDPVELPQCVHLVAATSQNFMRISLMADVPYHAILGCIEYVVQGNRQFDRAEVGG